MWIKASKREFARPCRGPVALEASKVRRLALRAQGAVLAATFGLRFAVVADAAEAERTAKRLLAGETLAEAAE